MPRSPYNRRVWVVELAPEFEPELLAVPRRGEDRAAGAGTAHREVRPYGSPAARRYAQRLQARQHEGAALRCRRRRVAPRLRVRSEAESDPARSRRQERWKLTDVLSPADCSCRYALRCSPQSAEPQQGTEVMEVRMARTLDQVIAKLRESERAKIEARAQELI